MRERLLRKFQRTVSESKCCCLPKNLKECLLTVSVSYLGSHSSLNIRSVATDTRVSGERKSLVIALSQLKKRTAELTLCLWTELYSLQITFLCAFCSDPFWSLQRLHGIWIHWSPRGWLTALTGSNCYRKGLWVHLGLFHHAKSLFRTTFPQNPHLKRKQTYSYALILFPQF